MLKYNVGTCCCCVCVGNPHYFTKYFVKQVIINLNKLSYPFYMTDFQLLINNSIKELRKQTGLSQEKFCNKCDIGVNNYRNLEYNRHMPKATTINKICDTFHISPLELLSITLKKSSKHENLVQRLKELNDKQLDMINGFIDVLLTNKE